MLRGFLVHVFVFNRFGHQTLQGSSDNHHIKACPTPPHKSLFSVSLCLICSECLKRCSNQSSGQSAHTSKQQTDNSIATSTSADCSCFSPRKLFPAEKSLSVTQIENKGKGSPSKIRRTPCHWSMPVAQPPRENKLSPWKNHHANTNQTSHQ